MSYNPATCLGSIRRSVSPKSTKKITEKKTFTRSALVWRFLEGNYYVGAYLSQIFNDLQMINRTGGADEELRAAWKVREDDEAL
uniref:Uncharacterized protein n=1 Tax=Utricularia reniformis TaxID=192314 RepID=A0A1Y0B4I5_9LAMI|nr:hypothetical protein AEK19_MT2219 [Utricularia reniformis]ART32365.1 hypothetical protein AEK19_MT2219 [Utricularia reniformis]